MEKWGWWARLYNRGVGEECGTAGVTAGSTCSQGNSGVAILGVNIHTSPKSTTTPPDCLSEHFQVRDFFFNEHSKRDLPDSCSLFLCVKYKFPFCHTEPENTVFVNVTMHVEKLFPFRRSTFSD